MAISSSKYVDITSGIGGGVAASTRNLVGRLFTANSLLPVGQFLSFTSAADVGLYFGTTSEEYLRSVFYFGWISKNTTRAQLIQFARWADTAVAPTIRSLSGNATTLADWTVISSGSFGMTVGGVDETFTDLDFNLAASLTDVANIIETAVQTGTGTQYTSATVTYNATTNSFDFVGGDAVDATISVQVAGGGDDITGSGLLGWLPAATFSTSGTVTSGAIYSNGSAVETITDVLTASSDYSNDFGSFLFLTDLSLTIAEVVEAAQWNELQNVMYMFTVAVTSALASTWADVTSGVGAISGVALTVSDTSGEYPEQMPMMIEAATNYNASNAVQNYMFQQFSGITPSVTTNAQSTVFDAIYVNYYGATQTAGQTLSFYQRGFLQGASIATNIIGMNTYVNEIWLKDAAGVALLNLLIGLTRVPANEQGRSQILGALQDVIDLALLNGTISVGKTLTSQQKAFITAETGDDKAWYQVQNSGYWIDCIVIPQDSEATYTIIYSKDDVIRKVIGTHSLI